MTERVWTEALPYFPEAELRCRGSHVIRLDLRFAAALPELRRSWGKPLSPTSVCRTPEHNARIRGHERSLHMTENPVHPVDGTMAADLAWWRWPTKERQAFYRHALALGWSCGLHQSFIHVDRRVDFGLPVVTFHYPEWHSPFPDE